MNSVLNYLFEVLVCSGVLYTLYAVWLDRRVPFRWCRIYLTWAGVLSLLIPLLRIPVWPHPAAVLPAAPFDPTGPADAEVAAAAETSNGWSVVLLALYLFGVLTMLLPLVRQVLLLRRWRRGAEIAAGREYRLVRTAEPIEACSFLRTVYVWRQTPEKELAMILLHEASHVRHRHSLERMAMETMKALCWWNPFFWLAAMQLNEVEEFEADRDVIAGGCDCGEYMQLILKQLLGVSPEIASGLRTSRTRKRFRMMAAAPRPPHARWRMALALPVVAGLVCAFSFTVRADEYRYVESEGTPLSDPHRNPSTPLAAPPDQREADGQTAAAKPSEPAATEVAQSAAEPFLVSEVMPRFRDGDLLYFRQWVKAQINYPKEALEQRIEGTVILSFVVERDGSVDEVQVLRSPNQLFADEAVRVVKRSPRWEPAIQQGKKVRLRFTLPVDFQLAPAEPVLPAEEVPAEAAEAETASGTARQDLLADAASRRLKQVDILVDGRIVSEEELNSLDPSQIGEITVWKPTSGKSSIVITTKNAPKE